MKAVKLFFFLLIVPLFGFGQHFFPTYKDKPTWNLDNWSMGSNDVTIKISCRKDTIINGLEYTQVNWYNGTKKPVTYRVDSQKVYALNPKDSFKEFLLYDFSVKVGDSLSLFFDVTFNQVKVVYKCKAIDTIIEYGQSFRKYTFDMIDSIWHHPYNGYLQMVWYEGVGDYWHPFYCFAPQYPAFEFGYNLLCMDTNSSLVFMPPGITSCITGVEEESNISEGITISPNPFHSGFNLDFKNIQNSGIEIRILDMTGKEKFYKKQSSYSSDFIENISPDIPAGIYILRIQVGGKMYAQKLIKQ